jgi:hypothetical protein
MAWEIDLTNHDPAAGELNPLGCLRRGNLEFKRGIPNAYEVTVRAFHHAANWFDGVVRFAGYAQCTTGNSDTKFRVIFNSN